MIVGLALVLLIVVVVLITRRSRTSSKIRTLSGDEFPLDKSLNNGFPSGEVGQNDDSMIHPYIASLLQRWTAAGVLSAENATSIRDFERRVAREGAVSSSVPTRRFPAVAEALGYLGGVLGIVGVITLVSNFWSDWPSGLRLATTGGATLLAVAAGRFVRESEDQAFARMRWFLWTVATPAIGLFAYVLARDLLDWERGSQYWLMIALATGCLNGMLWAGRFRPIQEALTFIGLMVAIGTATGDASEISWAGVAVWASGIVLVSITLWRTFTTPVIPMAIGAGSIIVGGYLTVSDWEGLGFLFVALSASALVGLATVNSSPLPSQFRVLFGVVGCIGLVQSVPGVLVYYAQDAGVMTGCAVWVIGVLLFLFTRIRLVRAPVVFQIVGGVSLLVGPAITGTQSLAVATISGLLVAVGLIAVGITPGRVLMSMFGLVGLLVYVPWTIAHFFPGKGRVPLLITVSGLLIVIIAVVLARTSGRLRAELQNSLH